MRARDRVGQQIGDFRLEDVAATDEVSSWYGARRSDERATVRVLDVTGGDVETRFLAWRSLVRRIEHPAIPRVRLSGTSEGGEPFHLVEAIDGAPLNPPIEGSAAVSLVSDVLDGLDACHASGALVYALVPGRILVGGGIHLLDVGLFEILGEDARAAALRARAGYLAPEVVSAERSELDARADVFAAGVLLFALLTGRPPADPRNAAGELPVALAPVVERALSFDPRERYRSAAAMRDALVAALKPS